jgi:hypothetical protein
MTQKTLNDVSDEELFAEAFKSELTSIHRWNDEEEKIIEADKDFGFVFKEVKEDKNGKTFFSGTAFYPDGRQQSEILYPPKSMETQLLNIFGDLDECIGSKVLVKYGGKKPHPSAKGKTFHSVYVQMLG